MGTAYACAILLLLSLLSYYWTKTSKLPPGPPGLPIIGNIHQLATDYPWKQIQEWHRVYGPIFHLRMGQRTVILIGNHQVAKEVLSKRSTLYSSRPRLIVAGECIAKHLDTALLPYGPRWRQFHAIHTSFLNSRKSQLYRPLQELESRRLLFNFLSSNDFDHELYRYSSSLIFALLYGREFASGDEPELKEFKQLVTAVFENTSLGSWLVDAFPIFNHLPRPFASWKVMGDKLHNRTAQLYESKFTNALNAASWNWCKQSVSALTDAPSVPQEDLKFVLGEIFGAGSRTTAGSLSVAILACVSYPDAMRRAQDEMDKIIGGGRLPTFDDFSNLPYLRSFVDEVFRWRPLTPAGVAHSPTKDDEYCGLFIPQGAAVVANYWSLEMDETVFQRPEDFLPERWIDNADLPQATFGYGKRVCPGQFLARNSLLLVISRLLWAFDIKWKEGQETTPDQLGMTQEGIFSRPCPFEASFSIRSPSRQEVVRREWEDSNSDVDSLLNEIGRQFSAV